MKQKLFLLFALLFFSLEYAHAKYNGTVTDTAALRDSINNTANREKSVSPGFLITPSDYSTPSVTFNAPGEPTLSADAGILCRGSSKTITITGMLNGATEWKIYSGSCAGTLVTSTTSSTFSVSPLTTTTYYVREEGGSVTPGTCASITITVNAPIITTGINMNIACRDASTGYASVSASGGTAPYTYSWSPSGGTAALASSLAAGTYTCTVTDANSCTATRSFTIVQPLAALTATTSQVNVSCFGGSNGSATVVASGGTGTKTYSWSPSGGTKATASGLRAGTYTCTITDEYECSIKKTFTITEPTAVVAGYTLTNIACYGSSTGSATMSPEGGTAPYTYSWAPSGGTAVTASGLSAETYTCTITDANYCATTKTITISQPAAALSATSSQVNVSCFGGSNGSATVVASGGAGTKTYSWSPAGGTGATASGLSAGTYTCTVTDENSCQTTATVTIAEPAAALLATTSQVNVSCNGGSNGSATVTATGGTGTKTYSWSPAGGTAATATGLMSGTYTCTITDENSCQTTATVTITEPTALSATNSSTNVSCNGGSNATATAIPSGGTAPYTYSWSPMGGTGASASGLSLGTYTCTITDMKGCEITTTVPITQPSALTATTGDRKISCNGGSDGMASVEPSGGTAPYSYNWSPSGGTSDTAKGLTAGTYTCTITDDKMCSITKTVTLVEPDAVSASATPANETICSGSPTNIEIKGSPSGTALTWAVATVSGTVSGGSAGSNSDIQQTLTGNGVVKYTITPKFAGCTGSSIEVLVTVNALTSIATQANDKNIDENENASFAIEADHASTYQWQENSGSGFVNISDNSLYSGSSTTQLNISHVPESLHGYTYRCIVIGNCAPVTSQPATLSVRVRAVQTISFAATDSKTYGTPDYTPSAMSTSGLAVSYSSSDENVATVVDGKIHIKNVGQTTITASQPGDNDYKPATDLSQVLTVVPKNITVTLHANPLIHKTYDGSTDIQLDPSNYTLIDIVENDDISVSGTARFETSQAGTGKKIIVDDFVLEGDAKDNYQLTTNSADITGTIGKKDITVYLQAEPSISKTYDGNKNINLTKSNYILDGLLEDADVTVTGTPAFDNKNAGINKTITVSALTLNGADQNNYQLTATTATVTGYIEQKEITVELSETPEISKEYNGNSDAQLAAGNYLLQDIVSGDEVSVTGIANYSNRHVGSGKKITVDHFVLDGADKNNYALTTSNAVIAGYITPRKIRVSLQLPVISKEYDGTVNATINDGNYLVEGIISGDDITVTRPSVGEFDNKHGGGNKKITVSNIVITGEDENNYELESATIQANIGQVTPRPVTITSSSATKVYGATEVVINYTAEGLLESDVLAGGLNREPGNNVGTYPTTIGSLTGGSDYLIWEFISSSFIITPAPLTITPEDKTRLQGAENPAFSFKYEGWVNGDHETMLTTLPKANTAATIHSPIGNYEITASDASASNYSISYGTGKLSVVPSDNKRIKVWASSSSTIEVRIHSDIAQQSVITLYTSAGAAVQAIQQKLVPGSNSATIYTTNLAREVYIVSVVADKFKEAARVRVK